MADRGRDMRSLASEIVRQWPENVKNTVAWEKFIRSWEELVGRGSSLITRLSKGMCWSSDGGRLATP